MDDNSWNVVEEPFCEHCGALEPLTPVFFDGMTAWCESCAYANGEDDPPLDFQKKALKMKIDFFHKRISALTKELKSLGGHS